MTRQTDPAQIEIRGRLSQDRALDGLTWLRVGGPADWLFQPADVADLQSFLAALDPSVPVFPMGVGSNLIVRDGGIRAVVIRLGPAFGTIETQGDTVVAGAAALDARVAKQAAEAGIDLTFLRTIPGAFRNPAGYSSTGQADDTHELKAWKVIDDAGMRGATRGGAQMSPKHSNFLINTGDATAADLEGLGEEVRKKVYEASGIQLEWEVLRIGEPGPAQSKS